MAIILTLLDTGVRASELCGIRFGDLNLCQNGLKARGKGPGTEGKERIAFFGK
jgi:site-specific recombinase XerD